MYTLLSTLEIKILLSEHINLRIAESLLFQSDLSFINQIILFVYMVIDLDEIAIYDIVNFVFL